MGATSLESRYGGQACENFQVNNTCWKAAFYYAKKTRHLSLNTEIRVIFEVVSSGMSAVFLVREANQLGLKINLFCCLFRYIGSW